MRQTKRGDEIDLVLLIKTMWKRRRSIIKITGVFIVFGLFVAFLSAEQYTASSTFIPQSDSSSNGGRLGGLASLAGINIGGTGVNSEIPPTLYPQIVNGVKFKRALLEVPITVEELNTAVTYREYYEEVRKPGFLGTLRKYTIGLPRTILNVFRSKEVETVGVAGESSSDIIRISQREITHFRRIEGQLDVVYDEMDGIVELSFNMPEALMAAEMAKAAEEFLQREVIAYKIQNAQEQLNFTLEQFNEKQEEFRQKQQGLADFRDRNQNISSALARNQLVRLETEYNFSFDLYSEMAKQLEHSKLQVSKDTPVFSVINPVSVPTQRSAPNKKIILLLYTILGFIVAIVFVFFRQTVNFIKNAD